MMCCRHQYSGVQDIELRVRKEKKFDPNEDMDTTTGRVGWDGAHVHMEIPGSISLCGVHVAFLHIGPPEFENKSGRLAEQEVLYPVPERPARRAVQVLDPPMLGQVESCWWW